MKTQISFKRILIATGASATLLFLSLPLIVGAVPTAVPTGGNVDANFNTVSSSLYYDADDTGYYLDPTSIGTALSIAGGINDPSANPVVLNDNDGTQVLTNDKSSGVIINPLSWGRQEISTTNSLNFSTGGNVVMNLNSGNGSIFFSDGVGSKTVGINRWGLWNSTSNPLKIIDSNGLGISDNAGNVGLLIKSNGDISDSSGSVTIDDPQGMVVNASDPATGIIVNNPDGGITVNASNNGGITIDSPDGGMTIDSEHGGLTINSDDGGIELNSTTGGIVNNLGSVKIDDSLNVTSSIHGDSHLFLDNNAYIDSNLDVDGSSNLKGTIYNSSGNNSGRVYVNDHLYVNGYLYAPFLYDKNNPSYYANPSHFSYLKILEVQENINADTINADTINESSDVRLKKNISKITDSLSKVEDLRGVTFEWRDNKNKDEQMGFIAQEMEKVVPEIVTTGEDGYKLINYNGVIPLVVNAIQELKEEKDAEVEAMKAETEALRAEVVELKAQVEEMKSLFAN